MMQIAGLPSGQQFRLAGWGLAAALMVALAFGAASHSINWGIEDIAAAGLLLGGLGLALELAVRLVRPLRARLVIALLLIAAFALIGAELAVGLLH